MKSERPHPCVLIIGCGYIGQRVAQRELEAGRPVAALVRSEPRAVELTSLGLQVCRGDLDHPRALEGLPTAVETLYYFAPPPPEGDRDPRIRHLLHALDALRPPRRVVYISTSGVYGDCRGEWVDEKRLPAPQSDRGRRRLDAEMTLIDWAATHRVDAIRLRVPGIYGPGRLPLERIRRQTPVLCEADSPWSNRIHADDLVTACLAAARRGKGGEIYQVSDGAPSTMTDYFWQIADLFHLPRPPAISLEEAKETFSANLLSFLCESRRLSNRKMIEELGVEPRYPDLARGLEACREGELSA